MSRDRKVNIAVFISGSGTNLQAILDRCADGFIPARTALVVSSTKKALGLSRAEKAGVPTAVYRRKDFDDEKQGDKYILDLLERHNIEFIALAGYLKLLPKTLVNRYRGRIINIHPALLPDFGGKGMYGMHVHQAVIQSGRNQTGVTIHLVDEEYDHGLTLAEERVPVLPDDTPDTLAERVLQVEHALYPRVIKEQCEKLIKEGKQ